MFAPFTPSAPSPKPAFQPSSQPAFQSVPIQPSQPAQPTPPSSGLTPQAPVIPSLPTSNIPQPVPRPFGENLPLSPSSSGHLSFRSISPQPFKVSICF